MSSIHVADDDVADKIIGVRWNTGSDSSALQQIDIDGNVITQKSHAWFDRHPVWGGMKRCTLTVDGVPTFGADAKGSNLALDGSAGQVMVRVPRYYIKSEKSGNYLKWWISPFPYPGFDLHPAFKQRGGTERAQLYVGAYVGGLAVNSSGTLYMLSATGKQPWTGTAMGKLPFGTGATEIAKGDTVVGATSGNTVIVVAVHKVSGDWGTGNAAGFLYVKYPGANWSNWTNPEDIQVGGVTRAATTGTGEALGLTRQLSETYCNNIGSTR